MKTQRYKIVFVLVVSLSASDWIAQAQTLPQARNLEIFVDGKKFDSVKDYKDYMITRPQGGIVVPSETPRQTDVDCWSDAERTIPCPQASAEEIKAFLEKIKERNAK